eukprot:8064933-Lingulodinium_polyedra.AAC.1
MISSCSFAASSSAAVRSIGRPPSLRNGRASAGRKSTISRAVKSSIRILSFVMSNEATALFSK